jgi:hypothetical protein
VTLTRDEQIVVLNALNCYIRWAREFLSPPVIAAVDMATDLADRIEKEIEE